MFNTLTKAAYKHGYLIITAAWLYTLSFIFSNYWSYTASPVKVQQTLQRYITVNENKFNEIESDTAKLRQLLSDDVNGLKEELFNQLPGIFTYQLNDLGNPIQLYWNTYLMSPQPEDLLKRDGNYFLNYANGSFEFIKRTKQWQGRTYLLTAMIPVQWHYFKETRYLQSNFPAGTDIGHYYQLTNKKNATAVRNSENRILFFIEKKKTNRVSIPDSFSVILRLIAILCLLFFINALATELVNSNETGRGIVFLLITLLLLRLVLYFFNFPFNFKVFKLFDPAIYTSNFINHSLGDLLINSILFYWIGVFLKSSLIRRPLQFKLSARNNTIVCYACLVMLVIFTFVWASMIRSLVTDSSISFNVTNFYSLNIFTVVSFIIISLLAIAFYHFAHLLIYPSVSAGIKNYMQLGTISVAGLIFLTLTIGNELTGLRALLLAWLILYTWLITRQPRDIPVSLFRSPYFLFWVTFFSASIALLIITQNRSIETEKEKKVADSVSVQTDPSAESLLGVAVGNINDNFLKNNFHRFYNENSNAYIKDSLINENFSGYLNKYDTRIYTFSSYLKPLFNNNYFTYTDIKTTVKNPRPVDKTPGLSYFDVDNDKFGFVYGKEIKDKDSLVGYIYVIARPRQYKTEALFPELFKEDLDAGADINSDYSYAVYNNLKLVNSFNEYTFPTTIAKKNVPHIGYKYVSIRGQEQLWFNAGNNKVIVVVKTHSLFIEALTLFAYVFCSLLILLCIIHLGTYLLRVRFRVRRLTDIFHFNIRTQIQTTIIAISVFSFLVIGAATISFFIYRFDRSNHDRLSKQIQAIGYEIESRIKSAVIFDDAYFSEAGNNSDLGKKILDISEIHNVDVNFYDKSGDLSVSTQPYIYNKHILSDKMEPRAWYEMSVNKAAQYIQTESFNNFSFLSIYVPVRDENGNTLAYLNIPYLNSQNELKQEISNFLVTLINLNAFIFVIAGAIALLVTNRITSSFSIISTKMKALSLSGTNEEIRWDKNDEIGVLVNEYNKMVKKLEESAEALARSEREDAWREMARQIAHEIKNPLTPMKLSIQYLEKAVESNAENVKELSQSVAKTLVQQIDQLAKIASDFSQFANIAETNQEVFDLTEVVSSLVSLYSTDERLKLVYELDEKASYKVYADKTQLNRLFTNLIKNGIEAAQDEEMVEMAIKQYNQHERIIISIRDNGNGIPREMWKRIFVPNFTTKSSGTGLGLAICRGIVEKAKGTIWFETEEGKGTTFFVSLPQAKT
ncbi:MAG: nitrogen regulation protein NtrY [Chitinophagaceae bacterium]|nr:nitrogen regulation protein NtrY [Chitinophagaceae bacterium]